MDQEKINRYSKSCKKFNKKKSLGFFILILEPDTIELKHREMLRIVNPKDGEYYIIPRPLAKFDFHISYHKSGTFHWAVQTKHELPKEREEDFRTAFLSYMAMQATYGWIIGYCIAVGPKVKINVLRKMLQLLSGYVPIRGLDTHNACEDIYSRKHVSFRNEKINSHDDIKKIPMASGLMLVELKKSIGSLHTINVTRAEERFVYHRMNWNSETKTMNFKEILYDDIAVAHCLLM